MSNSQIKLQSDSYVNTELVVSAMTKSLSQDCYNGTECVDLSNPLVTCDSGYSLVGYDKKDCRNDAVSILIRNMELEQSSQPFFLFLFLQAKWGAPICCATASKPSSCQWCGGGLDCDGK
jgi:hypothetical protein